MATRRPMGGVFPTVPFECPPDVKGLDPRVLNHEVLYPEYVWDGLRADFRHSWQMLMNRFPVPWVFTHTMGGNIGIFVPYALGELEALSLEELVQPPWARPEAMVMPVPDVCEKVQLVSSNMMVNHLTDVFEGCPGEYTWGNLPALLESDGVSEAVVRATAEYYHQAHTAIYVALMFPNELWETVRRAYLPRVIAGMRCNTVTRSLVDGVEGKQSDAATLLRGRYEPYAGSLAYQEAPNMARSLLCLLLPLSVRFTHRDRTGNLVWCVDEDFLDGFLGFMWRLVGELELPCGMLHVNISYNITEALVASGRVRTLDYMLVALCLLGRVWGLGSVAGGGVMPGDLDFGLPVDVVLTILGLGRGVLGSERRMFLDFYVQWAGGKQAFGDVVLNTLIGCSREPLPVAWPWWVRALGRVGIHVPRGRRAPLWLW